MQKFKEGTWEFILFLKLFVGYSCFLKNVIEDRLDVCFEVFPEEVREEGGDVLEPGSELMGFDVDGTLFELVEGEYHDEDGHVEGKRCRVYQHAHDLGHHCLVVLHYNTPHDPVKHRQCLVVSQFGYLPDEHLLVVLRQVVHDDVLPSLYALENTSCAGTARHGLLVHHQVAFVSELVVEQLQIRVQFQSHGGIALREAATWNQVALGQGLHLLDYGRVLALFDDPFEQATHLDEGTGTEPDVPSDKIHQEKQPIDGSLIHSQ